MTVQDFEKEKRYCLIIHIATKLRDTGLITESELKVVKESAALTYKPIVANLINYSTSN